MSEREVARSLRPQSLDAVLSSMCTRPHPAAREAAERFLAANPGDPATYEAVAELESRAVSLLGRVAELSDPHGYVTSGGTEANIQAVRAARNLAETDDPLTVAPESAHFSVRKAASVLDVDVKFVPTAAPTRPRRVPPSARTPFSSLRWPERRSTVGLTRFPPSAR